MTGPLSKIGKAAKAIKKATAKAPVKTFKTADGYTFYELPNGSIVDNLKPSQVDMSWPSRQEFMSDMEGTAFEAGDELGQRRATTESIGVPTQERLMENITQFGEDDISNFYKARREQLIDQERKANIKLVPGQEEDMAAGGALKKTIKAAQKVGEKSARQEALNMARGIAKESFVRPSQEKGVVYHGTNKDITKFKRTLTPDDHVPGISVTDDPASASLYAEDKAMKQTGGEGANVLPLLVRTEKPMYYPDLEDWTKNKALEKGFPIKDPDDFAAFDVPPETLLKWLKEEGYDAIDYRDDPMMGYGLRVFDPEQLKSAIGNRTYDPRDPDITKAKGGAIDHDLKAWHEKNMAKGGKVKEETKESEPALPHPEVLKYMSLDDLVNPEVNFPRRYPGQTAALPSDLASDSNKEVQDRRLKHGALEAVNWAVRNLPQPVNPILQTMRNIVEARKRRLGAFSLPPDIQEASGIVILPEELTPIEDKKPSVPRFKHGGEAKAEDEDRDWKLQDFEYERYFDKESSEKPETDMLWRNPRIEAPKRKDEYMLKAALGGEVRMSNGGNAVAQVEAQLAAGVPVFMDRGEQGVIARQIIAEQDAARKREEAERQAKMQARPFGEKVRGGLEAAQTVQSAIGRSLASPFVALAQGEEAAQKFAEDVVLPQTDYGIYALQRTGEALEPIGRAIERAKIPDVPFLPEVPTYIPGIARQAQRAAAQAGRAIDEAVPQELKNLPVGASIQPVGPGGERLSVNDLIRMLEAGEELTPEQRQKAEYSKAQKEKYAQANIARAQKEPAPKEEAVKVPANEMGFFSSVEKAAANLKREEGSGDAFLSDIMKFNPSAGELEATGIVDFLKGKKSVTRQEVQDYIDQHSVQIEEVIRGTILDDVDRQKLNDINRRISRGFREMITPEEEEWFEATRDRLAQFKEPRFEQKNLILPGGKNYKEILLKFPMKQNAPVSTEKSAATMLFENNMKEKYGGETFPSIYNRLTPDEIEKYDMYVREDINARKTESILQDKRNNFRTDHWPDDPNTFMHLRMQDMTIGGKKTLVIEEIQSDWHQTGRKKGYQRSKDLTPDEIDLRFVESEVPEGQDPSLYPGYYEAFDKSTGEFLGRHSGTLNRDQAMRDAVMSANQFQTGVPDAPFKKDWYQLGVKRLLKYAADNDYDQVALVGPDEQIRRGSLGTHIDGLIYEKNADGTIKLMAEKGQSVVLDKTVEPKDLDLYVGKDVAKRILESKETDGTLTGDDLKIGGEGMRQYYGRNYPEYMNKLGKKYGTEAKKTQYTIKEFEPDDVEEVYTGEFDRYGREIMAFKVVDRETGEDIAFEYDFDKVLKEANKKAPATDMWLMDLPAKMKSDVKIGQPFKEGGAVTKDKDLMRWHKIQQLAAGGAIRKLAKSAEKALEKAKRMTREEAEKAGLWHDISDIKLEKPLSEVQKKVVKNPKSKLAEKKVISPEELQGGTAVQLLGDRAAAGQILEELEGVPMNIELQGGPGFMREHGGWASHKVPLSKLEKKIRAVQESGDPVYGVYTAMGPQGVDFNTFVSESLVKSLDLSELRKKDIDKFNQEVRKDIPGFVGIESPGLLESLIIGPGAQRTKFVQTMAKEDFQKAGFPNVGFARYAVTEPELLDVPIGQSGYSISQFGPEMKMEQKSGHRTYPYDLTGTYIGGLAQPLPADVMFPSFFEARRLLSKPESGGYRAMQMSAPVQQLDQEWLDNAMQYLEMQKKLTGKKKGGLASIKVRNKRNG